jgi:tetratricopeptide (TPR) repeat protein
MADRERSPASEAWQAAARAEPEVWIDEGPVRDEAEQAVERARRPSRRRPEPDDEPGEDPSLDRSVTPAVLARYKERMRDASRAFRRERYEEARRILRPMADRAPTAESVRELHGLTLYRLGRWKAAAAELEAFSDLTRSTEQHPVLADCYRALGRHGRVEELWEELRSASPSADLVAEGRIVAAGSLADQGRVADAIALLESAKGPGKRPQAHHLRTAYALADLHERAGDVPRARQLFELVASHDPELGDAAQRARALR